MKKKIIRSVAVAALATLAFTACDNSKPQVDKKSEGTTAAVPTDMKIAYVEVDSIMTQYKFC